MASYLGFGTCCGSLRVNDPFLGAMCPSQSGLMNKHIVKKYRDKPLKGQYFIFGALCPSKSGLTHKHIAKHIVMVQPYCEESVKHQGHLICLSTDRSNNHAMHLECPIPVSNPQPFPFRTFYLPGYVYDMLVYKSGLVASPSAHSQPHQSLTTCCFEKTLKAHNLYTSLA